MKRVDDMTARLPQLYRDGELLKAVLSQPAVQLEALTEEMTEVQRAHWFDTTLELDEAAKLAAVLDIPPEDWQSLDEYRAWVHSLRNARLRDGAVTVQALQRFVVDYSAGYRAATRTEALPPINEWSKTPSRTLPAFVENPLRRVYQRAPAVGGIEPLQQFQVVQRGLDEAAAEFLVVGLPEGPESSPLIANLTSGQGLLFLDNVPPGKRLWISATEDGLAQALLEGTDVTHRLRSVSGLQPGVPWEPPAVEDPPRAISLRRGSNDFWFLPVAHYDVLGLDRFLLALADLVLRQGRYDETDFDRSLFYQDPAANLSITWLETQPARFEVQLPAGSLLSPAGQLAESILERERLDFSLNQAVQKLKPVGVGASVGMLPFQEQQGQMDRLVAVLPLVHREGGPTGRDSLPDAGAVFDVTHLEDSTFR